MHCLPLLDDAAVDTRVVVSHSPIKPLTFGIPLLVSDMSFRALSEEAEVDLAADAELAEVDDLSMPPKAPRTASG